MASGRGKSVSAVLLHPISPDGVSHVYNADCWIVSDHNISSHSNIWHRSTSSFFPEWFQKSKQSPLCAITTGPLTIRYKDLYDRTLGNLQVGSANLSLSRLHSLFFVTSLTTASYDVYFPSIGNVPRMSDETPPPGSTVMFVRHIFRNVWRWSQFQIRTTG